ncbi:MAG: PEGA domain-containing protein, partial [Candidatus Marinimicrobia bacterium]|nr:PEGA domain-containing protein [Candidatus Neomarinimicrobiota bacterium]
MNTTETDCMQRLFRHGLSQIVLIFLVFFSGISSAMAATVSGIVTDAESADPLSYANVILRDTQQGATTDEQGYYVIQNVPPGEYTLAVSYIGYAQRDTTISVQPDENVRVDFQLQPQSIGG